MIGSNTLCSSNNHLPMHVTRSQQLRSLRAYPASQCAVVGCKSTPHAPCKLSCAAHLMSDTASVMVARLGWRTSGERNVDTKLRARARWTHLQWLGRTRTDKKAGNKAQGLPDSQARGGGCLLLQGERTWLVLRWWCWWCRGVRADGRELPG